MGLNINHIAPLCHNQIISSSSSWNQRNNMPMFEISTRRLCWWISSFAKAVRFNRQKAPKRLYNALCSTFTIRLNNSKLPRDGITLWDGCKNCGVAVLWGRFLETVDAPWRLSNPLWALIVLGVSFENRTPSQPSVALSYAMMMLKKWKLANVDMAKGCLNTRFLLLTLSICELSF